MSESQTNAPGVSTRRTNADDSRSEVGLIKLISDRVAEDSDSQYADSARNSQLTEAMAKALYLCDQISIRSNAVALNEACENVTELFETYSREALIHIHQCPELLATIWQRYPKLLEHFEKNLDAEEYNGYLRLLSTELQHQAFYTLHPFVKPLEPKTARKSKKSAKPAVVQQTDDFFADDTEQLHTATEPLRKDQRSFLPRPDSRGSMVSTASSQRVVAQQRAAYADVIKAYKLQHQPSGEPQLNPDVMTYTSQNVPLPLRDIDSIKAFLCHASSMQELIHLCGLLIEQVGAYDQGLLEVFSAEALHFIYNQVNEEFSARNLKIWMETALTSVEFVDLCQTTFPSLSRTLERLVQSRRYLKNTTFMTDEPNYRRYKDEFRQALQTAASVRKLPPQLLNQPHVPDFIQSALSQQGPMPNPFSQSAPTVINPSVPPQRSQTVKTDVTARLQIPQQQQLPYQQTGQFTTPTVGQLSQQLSGTHVAQPAMINQQPYGPFVMSSVQFSQPPYGSYGPQVANPQVLPNWSQTYPLIQTPFQQQSLCQQQNAQHHNVAQTPVRPKSFKIPGPSPFHGSSKDEVSITTWFFKFENYAEISQVNEADRIKLISSYLEGRASEIYQDFQMSPQTQWADLKAYLIEALGIRTDAQAILLECMSDTTQNLNIPPSQHIHKILRRLKQAEGYCEGNDQTVVRAVLEKYPKDMRSHLDHKLREVATQMNKSQFTLSTDIVAKNADESFYFNTQADKTTFDKIQPKVMGVLYRPETVVNSSSIDYDELAKRVIKLQQSEGVSQPNGPTNNSQRSNSKKQSRPPNNRGRDGKDKSPPWSLGAPPDGFSEADLEERRAHNIPDFYQGPMDRFNPNFYNYRQKGQEFNRRSSPSPTPVADTSNSQPSAKAPGTAVLSPAWNKDKLYPNGGMKPQQSSDSITSKTKPMGAIVPYCPSSTDNFIGRSATKAS